MLQLLQENVRAPAMLIDLGALPLAPAIANAVCHATGERFRELPITPEKLLA